MNPLQYIDLYDAFLLTAGIVLRFLFVINAKAIQFQTKFKFKSYFDIVHIIRWSIHILTCVIGILVFPEFTVKAISKFYPEFDSWLYLFDVVIGFLGYDIIKITEKITLNIYKKLS